MKKILATFLIFSSIGLGVIAFGVGGGPRPNASADAFNRGQDVDNSSAIVQLKGDPLSINSATKPPAGKKIDFNGNAVRSYLRNSLLDATISKDGSEPMRPERK